MRCWPSRSNSSGLTFLSCTPASRRGFPAVGFRCRESNLPGRARRVIGIEQRLDRALGEEGARDARRDAVAGHVGQLLIHEDRGIGASLANEAAIEPLFGDALELPEEMELGFLAGVTPFRVEQPVGEMEQTGGRPHVAEVFQVEVDAFPDDAGIASNRGADKAGRQFRPDSEGISGPMLWSMTAGSAARAWRRRTPADRMAATRRSRSAGNNSAASSSDRIGRLLAGVAHSDLRGTADALSGESREAGPYLLPLRFEFEPTHRGPRETGSAAAVRPPTRPCSRSDDPKLCRGNCPAEAYAVTVGATTRAGKSYTSGRSVQNVHPPRVQGPKLNLPACCQ